MGKKGFKDCNQRNLEINIYEQLISLLNTSAGHNKVASAVKKQTGVDIEYKEVTFNGDRYVHNMELVEKEIDEFVNEKTDSFVATLIRNAPKDTYSEFNRKKSVFTKTPADADGILNSKNVHVGTPTKDKNGDYHVLIYFDEDTLRRPSLKSSVENTANPSTLKYKKGYKDGRDDLENIVHLFQTGYRTRPKNYAYGYWGNKEWTRTITGYGPEVNGSRVAYYGRKATPARVRSNYFQVEPGKDFLSRVINDFNIKNDRRTRSYAKLKGSYAEYAGGGKGMGHELSWDTVVGTYRTPYSKSLSNEQRSDIKSKMTVDLIISRQPYQKK